jgi:hypothetical protein
LTIRVYLRTMNIGSTTMTGFIYGIPHALFTKVIDFPNLGAVTVTVDNIIDAPLF